MRIARPKAWWRSKAQQEAGSAVSAGGIEPLPLGEPSPLLLELLEFQRRMDEEMAALCAVPAPRSPVDASKED